MSAVVLLGVMGGLRLKPAGGPLILPTPAVLQAQAPVSKGQALAIAFPANAATPQSCDVHSADYCIVDGNFIFGPPVDPALANFSESYPYASTEDGSRKPHRGVDFSANEGTPVLAAADGEVVFAGSEKTGMYGPPGNYYGYFIVIRHANDLYTLYGHLSKIQVVAGQTVQMGKQIGEVGKTGVAIGPHLHFEVRQGGNGKDVTSTQNPELWLMLSKDNGGSLYGAISISFDADSNHKVQRNIVIEQYLTDSPVPTKVIFATTYPVGFERNVEDAALSNLPPGRYRIAVNDKGGARDRWLTVESGKLTQVYLVPQ